jgi:hypothetical protein
MPTTSVSNATKPILVEKPGRGEFSIIIKKN